MIIEKTRDYIFKYFIIDDPILIIKELTTSKIIKDDNYRRIISKDHQFNHPGIC